jgi:hypothetical protein
VPAEGKTALFSAFITITGPTFGVAAETEGGWKVTVPEGINGQSYVVLTGCDDVVNDETIVAGPAIVEITNI